MTALILAILSNPNVIAIIGGIAAALGFGLHQRRAGAKAEQAKQAAAERDSYAKHLDEIANAHIARNAVDGRLSDDDPYRRD